MKVTANDSSWTFNSHDFSLRQFDQGQSSVTELATIIEQGLIGKEWVMLTVEAQVRLGAGQEVFPSQELVLDSNSSKSRVLYQVAGIAGIHSQKLATLYVLLTPGIRRLMSWGLSPWSLMAL